MTWSEFTARWGSTIVAGLVGVAGGATGNRQAQARAPQGCRGPWMAGAEGRGPGAHSMKLGAILPLVLFAAAAGASIFLRKGWTDVVWTLALMLQ